VTDEDPRVTSPEERLRRFGQHDHVRVYGRDFATRLEQANFGVRADDFGVRLPPERQRYFGIDPGEHVYVCWKQAPGAARTAASETSPRTTRST
jgi:hypothetical protein